ncbi:hypothetical protein [uncultured Brevibacillus sp.]|uniref:hypothetical protein n=1 Tax=uncultured Brevibacillus sp. TaxID=169970 RepID=UPI00259998C1|nr:hypothetical protein [uncultured Brevibacillus sp.]
MSQFVLLEDKDHEYYAGKNYIYQGEYFPALCRKEQAKIYSSRKRAENAAEAVGNRTGVTFRVIELT